MLAVAAAASPAPRVPVTIIDLQGCPDCAAYGVLVSKLGLSGAVDLRHAMDLKVLLVDRTAGGEKYNAELHKFAACAGSMPKDYDPELAWYKVFVCAGQDGFEAESCQIVSGRMPPKAGAFLKACTSDKRSQILVDRMHAEAKSHNPGSYPWVAVGDTILDPPDHHDNDVLPMLHAVCKAAGAAQSAATRGCARIPPKLPDEFVHLRKTLHKDRHAYGGPL